MVEVVYLNGRLVPRSEAKLSPFDHGFLYGCGLFETMRAYRGQVFCLERHLARLLSSAEVLGLASGLSAVELKKAVLETLRANGLSGARLRLTVSAGEGEAVPDLSTCRGPTVLVTATSYTPPSPQTYEDGYRAMVSSLRRNSQSPLSRLKSANYLESLLARREARAAGADEALLLNEQGFLAEASTSNVFLVARGMLLTPSLESGVLPGITRAAILELAPGLGIEAVERQITLTELFQADEAFLTNSLMEIMPLTRIEARPIGSGEQGTVTGRLIAAYKDLVARETLSTIP